MTHSSSLQNITAQYEHKDKDALVLEVLELDIPLTNLTPEKDTAYQTLLILMFTGFAVTWGFAIVGLQLQLPLLAAFSNYLVDLGILNSKLLQGQIWRPLTASFMHGGLLHIILNLLMLHVFRMDLQKMYSGRTWLWIFLVSAYVGNVLVVLQNNQLQVLGASTGIMGMIGACLALPIKRRLSGVASSLLPPNNTEVTSLLKGLAIQLLLDQALPGIAYTAHIFGFLTGFAVAFLFRFNGAPQLIVSRDSFAIGKSFKEATTETGVRHITSTQVLLLKTVLRPEDFMALRTQFHGGVFGPKFKIFEIWKGNKKVTEETEYTVLADKYSVNGESFFSPEQLADAHNNQKEEPKSLLQYAVQGGIWYELYNNFSAYMLLKPDDLVWLHKLPAAILPYALWVGTHIGVIILTYFLANLLSTVLFAFKSAILGRLK